MNKSEKEVVKQMLERAVKSYENFRDDPNFPDSPYIRKGAALNQNAAFNLADYLHRFGFISFYECCQIWGRVDIWNDADDLSIGECSFDGCSANIDGRCKYVK